MESTDIRTSKQQLIKRKDSEMKYETEIFRCFGCDVVLQTNLDLTDKEYKRQFDAVAARLKKILNQIQMHEDYEDLLADSKRLDQIEGLLVDRMSNSAEKRCHMEQEIEGEPLEDMPF
jgi:hypothetical protein